MMPGVDVDAICVAAIDVGRFMGWRCRSTHPIRLDCIQSILFGAIGRKR